MGKLVGERSRETKKEREIESETDVPKLYPTMNMNSLCYIVIKKLMIYLYISRVIAFLSIYLRIQ